MFEPPPSDKTKNIEEDIFKSAEFWLEKGYGIQQKGQTLGSKKKALEADNVALDYYLSGVKIDPQHYPCIYNAGCCHFATGKFLNARKWFNLTTQINPFCPDGFYGKALSCLKLGRYEEALESMQKIDQDYIYENMSSDNEASASKVSVSTSLQMQQSKYFTKEQITFLLVLCLKILQRHQEANDFYQKL